MPSTYRQTCDRKFYGWRRGLIELLGEEFLEKYKAQKLEAANSATTAKPNPNRLSEALSQRIGVASQLLQVGETDRALDFAEPALSAGNDANH